MLYIRVTTTYDNPYSGFKDGDGKNIDKEVILSIDQYYNNGEYDAYSLGYWPKGFFCKESKTTIHCFRAKVKRSMFYLLDKLDKDYNMNSIFHINESKRRGYNYYLDIIVHSTQEELIKLYLSTIKDWCGKYKRIEKILFPESLSLKEDSSQNNSILTIEDIINKEKYSKSHQINKWDIDFPEFECGEEIETIIEGLEKIGAFISIVMFFNWLKHKIETKIQTNEINKCIKAIKEKHTVESLTYYQVFPMYDDTKYKKLYIFHQYANNELIAIYEVFYYIKTRHKNGKKYNCVVKKMTN